VQHRLVETEQQRGHSVGKEQGPEAGRVAAAEAPAGPA
jgi:hypothetical protein